MKITAKVQQLKQKDRPGKRSFGEDHSQSSTDAEGRARACQVNLGQGVMARFVDKQESKFRTGDESWREDASGTSIKWSWNLVGSS